MTPLYTLYLVRHGIAEPRGERWPDDDLRPLSPEGTTRMKRAARGLAALEEPVGVVLTSPLVRAVQTAEIVRKALGLGAPLVHCQALAPGGSPRDVAAGVQELGLSGAFVLVGHEPDLGALAGWLLGTRAPLAFKKGAVGRIDVAARPTAGSGRLVWFLPPRVLRGL